MKPNVGKSILGGLVGTAVMTMMMYKGAPMMIGKKMDIAERIGSMIGDNWLIGMAMHWMNGVIVFPLIFVFLISNLLPGKSIVKGILWALLLWLIAQAILMPMTGAGFFSSNNGGMKVVIASMMGHIIYGAILGAFSGCEKCTKD